MSIAYLDTHVAVFLHEGLIEELSTESKRQIEDNNLLISPTVLLEFDYLFRRKRIRATAKALYAAINASFGVRLCDLQFSRTAQETISITWMMDPFDRLIVAQAMANHSAPLITRDRLIRQHCRRAIW